MKPTMLALSLIFAGTSALASFSDLDVQAQTRELQVTELRTTAVAGVEGKEWKVITVELTPGSVDSQRFNPGAEFVYVLDGAGRLDVAGKPSVTLNQGSVATFSSTTHHVLKNTSPTKTLKVLVVSLAEKGQRRSALANPEAPRHQGAGRSKSNGDLRQQANNKQDTRPAGLVF